MSSLPLTWCLPLAAGLMAALGACGTLYPVEQGGTARYRDGDVAEDYEMASGLVPSGEDVASVEVFYDELEPYGSWTWDERLDTYVFAPYDAYEPYRDGTWIETEYGLTWVSDAPIDWAVAHYGRWEWRERWLWIPDTIWGPAWVDWRVGGGVIGWAPLGVRAPPARAWRFVPSASLFHPRLGAIYVRGARARAAYATSRAVHRYVRSRGGHRYVAGPDARALGPRVPYRALRDLPPRSVGRGEFAARARAASVLPEDTGRASPARSQRMGRADIVGAPARYRPARPYAPAPRGSRYGHVRRGRPFYLSTPRYGAGAGIPTGASSSRPAARHRSERRGPRASPAHPRGGHRAPAPRPMRGRR